MVAWGPTTLNDNWAMIFTWIAIPDILMGLQRGRQSALWWMGLGVLLGLAFLSLSRLNDKCLQNLDIRYYGVSVVSSCLLWAQRLGELKSG